MTILNNGLVTSYATLILASFVFFTIIFSLTSGFSGLVLCIVIASVVSSLDSIIKKPF